MTPAPPASGYLLILSGLPPRAFPLTPGRFIIGRAPEADLRIDEPSISRRHAVVHVGPPLTVEDAGGANGVLVGGSRLHTGDKAPLDAGSVFELGDVMIVVQRNADP